jgi:hypothetical protein
MHTKHQPDHYIAGICIEDQWIGEFYATNEELLEYAITNDSLGDPELQLIDDMIEAQLVYSKWWERIRCKN